MLERKVWRGLSPGGAAGGSGEGPPRFAEDNPPASADPDMALSLADDSGSLYGVGPDRFIGPIPQRIHTATKRPVSGAGSAAG